MEELMGKLTPEGVLAIGVIVYVLGFVKDIIKEQRRAKAAEKKLPDYDYHDLSDDMKLLSGNVSEMSKVMVDFRVEQATTKERLDHLRDAYEALSESHDALRAEFSKHLELRK